MEDNNGRKSPGSCRSGGSRVVDKNGNALKEDGAKDKKKTNKSKPVVKTADSEE